MNIFLSTDMADGADAWLSAQITGIWTSCETMAEDLWETALNIHPLGLAELGGANKGQQEKSIELNKLSRWKYDVSKCMGTILKEKYNFDSLEGKRSVREAYADAFKDDGINSIIGHKSFTALNLVRNLIVHTGGICDENYLRRKADLPPRSYRKTWLSADNRR